MPQDRKNLGQILLEQGLIDREALEHALRLQGRKLGEILIEENLADPVAVANALKFQAQGGRRTKRLSVEVGQVEDLLRRAEELEELVASPRAALAESSALALRRGVESLLLGSTSQLGEKAKLVATRTAGQLGREVQLRFEGGDFSLDRSLLEDLGDIVLHLLRNAVDHGIEPAQQRAAAGKPPRGLVSVRLSYAAGRLTVTVRDDGRGIDEEKVFAQATRRGLLTKPRSEVRSDELLRLLFTPGFSTADKATTISGHGVGLDVVEATALRLGGQVNVSATLAQGTEFSVSLPLRHVELPVIPVRAGRHWLSVYAPEVAEVKEQRGPLVPAGTFVASEVFRDEKREAVCRFVLKTAKASWAFDEIGPPQRVLASIGIETDDYPGVVGTARLAGGNPVLLIDLDLLASGASQGA